MKNKALINPGLYKKSAHAPLVPMEDLKPGMTINNVQPTGIDPEKVYEMAGLGLTRKALAACFGVDERTLETHFPKTIARAKADAAAKMLRMLHAKAQDTMVIYDTMAIDKLLKRLDPEPKDPPVVIAQQFNLPASMEKLDIDDINNLLMNKNEG